MGLESKVGVCPMLQASEANGKPMQNHTGMPGCQGMAEQGNGEMVSVAEAEVRHTKSRASFYRCYYTL